MYNELFDINENLYFTINDKYVRAISSICNYRKNKENDKVNGGDLKILNHIIGRCFLYLKGLEMPDKLTTVTETSKGVEVCLDFSVVNNYFRIDTEKSDVNDIFFINTYRLTTCKKDFNNLKESIFNTYLDLIPLDLRSETSLHLFSSMTMEEVSSTKTVFKFLMTHEFIDILTSSDSVSYGTLKFYGSFCLNLNELRVFTFLCRYDTLIESGFWGSTSKLPYNGHDINEVLYQCGFENYSNYRMAVSRIAKCLKSINKKLNINIKMERIYEDRGQRLAKLKFYVGGN